MYNYETRKCILSRDISNWENFNVETAAERLPLFDKDLVVRRKKFNELKKAADNIDVDAVEFDEDEFDFRPTNVWELREEEENNEDSSDDDDEGDFKIRGIKIPGPMQNVIPDEDSENSTTTEEGTSDGDSEEDTSSGDSGSVSESETRTQNSRVDRELARLGADSNSVNIEERMRTRNRVYYVDICNDEVVLNAEAVNSDAGTPKTSGGPNTVKLRT
jgi:hypothetical protein